MHAFTLAALLVAAPQNFSDLPPASSAAGPLKPTAPSKSTGDARGGVEALLGTREAISAAQWRKLGPGAAPVLEAIVENAHALATRRARALEGLVALRSPRAPALLERLVRAEEEPFVLRLAAVRGAGRTLGSARQLAALRPTLEKATDLKLRTAAADVLVHHPAGCAMVREQAEREGPEARSQLEVVLRRCATK